MGPAPPRRGGRPSRALGRLVMRGMGWRFRGAMPDVPRAVLIVAPHTSNWDFPIGMAAMLSLNLRVDWLGKDSLFRGVSSSLFHWLGGIPLDRGAPESALAKVASLFRSREKLFLGIAPEGTRQKADRWRTGFYRIARAAGVPIIPITLDYRTREVGMGPAFEPTGDYAADLVALQSHFTAAMARYPLQY